MKQSKANNKQTQELQNAAPETAESLAVSAKETAKMTPRIRKTGSKEITVEATRPLAEMLADLCALTGTRHNEVSSRIAAQLASSFQYPKPADADVALIQAIGTIAEIAPQNLTETMLATQMIATYEASLMFMRRATTEGQSIEGSDANVFRATRLMRLHLEQVEAMQKLKGKAGQQKVTVEHVHVYQGGQAIVGTVNAKGRIRGVGDDAKN
jgi:hypothetical protein